MIVTDLGDRWRLVTQPDHARFAGELLALWRGPEVAAHPRRGELLFAAREHDNGWREADAAPRWNAADGRPHDFLSVPPEVRGEVWLRGTGRFAAARPYAALLVTLHALSFLERRGEEAWDAMVGALEERRAALLEETGVAAEEAAADYRFLRFADTASLTVASGWTEAFSAEVPDGGGLRTIRGRWDPAAATLHLDPLPLAGATTFRVPARWVEKRDYGGDVDLAVALASARWQEMAVRVAP
jgi:hypothetical protein